MYVLLQITKRTPTPYSQAESAVADAVQAAGSAATQKALTAVERRADVSLNPQYGVWVPVNGSVLTPFTPKPTDVLNGAANDPPGGVRLGVGLRHPVERLTVARRRPHVTVVGLGPAGTDLLGDDVAARLESARGRAYLRTARHPAAAPFGGVPAFDHLYEAAGDLRGGLRRHRRGPGGGGDGGGARAGRLRRAGLAAGGRAQRRAVARRRPRRGDRPARPLLLGPGVGRPRDRPAGPGGAPGRRRGVRRRGRATAARSWWRSAGRATCSPRSSSASVDEDGVPLPATGAPAPPRARGRGGGGGRLVGPRSHRGARPPDVALHPGVGVGRRRRPPARRWTGWSSSWTRCGSAAPGTGPRPTRR